MKFFEVFTVPTSSGERYARTSFTVQAASMEVKDKWLLLLDDDGGIIAAFSHVDVCGIMRRDTVVASSATDEPPISCPA